MPALAVGQSMPLQIPTAGGTARVEITLTGLRTTPAETSNDPQHTRVLCFGFSLRNTGTVAWKSDDATAAFDWKWFGLDGQQGDAGTGIVDACREMGHQFAGLDVPAPLPGKTVSGYYDFAISSKPGAVEVADSEDSPFFRLNYGLRCV